MKKLLLVGGFGFIGKNLIDELYDKFEIYVISRSSDLKYTKKKNLSFYKFEFGKDSNLDKIIDEIKPNYIINLVSIVTAQRDVSLIEPMIDSNYKVVLELFKASRNLKNLDLFVNFGSIEEYGNISIPFRESYREKPNSPYSLSKQLSTNLSMLLYNNNNFPITVIRPGNVFGKHQNSKKFIPYIINNLYNNKKIEVTECGQKRDFIYVKDLVNIIEKILFNIDKFKGEIFNVSYGKSYSLKSIIEYCKDKINSKSIIEYGAIKYREDESMDLKCSIDKLQKNLKFDFKYNLFTGLDEYIELMKEG